MKPERTSKAARGITLFAVRAPLHSVNTAVGRAVAAVAASCSTRGRSIGERAVVYHGHRAGGGRRLRGPPGDFSVR